MALDDLFWHWQLRHSWGDASGGRSGMDRLCLTTQCCYQDIRFAYQLVFVWRQNGEVGPLFHTHAIFWTHLRTKRIRNGDNQPGVDFFPHLCAFEIGIHAGEWRGHVLLQSPVSDE
jgi:hypothetical protein